MNMSSFVLSALENPPRSGSVTGRLLPGGAGRTRCGISATLGGQSESPPHWAPRPTELGRHLKQQTRLPDMP